MKTLRKSKTRKEATVAKKLTPAMRLKEITNFVNICFALLSTATDGYDYPEIAEKTGLSLGTIYNLAHGRFSLKMQVRTLQLLGIAAGLKLDMVKYTVKVIAVED